MLSLALSILLAVQGDPRAAAPVDAKPEEPAAARRPNLVLIVLDDVGVDKLGAYHDFPAGAKPPCTPNLDALAAGGVLFRNAWTDPVCSATRAQVLTGRHGFRTGIGGILDFEGSSAGLSPELELTVPELLVGYDSSAVGKWHLAPATAAGLRHPLDSGFGFYAGTLFNIATPAIDCGPDCTPPDCKADGPLGYTNWVKVSEDPETHRMRQACARTYATIDTTDDAIARARAMQAPWFLYVAYNAVHEPTQRPPPELVPALEACATPDAPEGPQRFDVLREMLQALDAEIGRLLTAIRAQDPDAWIFVLGDNGTAPRGAEGGEFGCFGYRRSKGTLYQGGIHVPLLVAGPGVQPGECAALVSSTDLFATFAELAGVTSAADDSVSLRPYLTGDRTPRRATVYAENFQPDFVSPDRPGMPAFEPKLHTRAVRNERYKLIRVTRRKGSSEELYDLRADPCETTDLCAEEPSPLTEEQRANLEALRAELVRLGVYE